MAEIKHTVRSKISRRTSPLSASVIEEDEFETEVKCDDLDLMEVLREVMYAYDSKRIESNPKHLEEDDI